MSQRQSDMLWLSDMLEHLRSCQKQLEWSQDPTSVHYLAETMLRDLDCCRRLCQNMHRRTVNVCMN